MLNRICQDSFEYFLTLFVSLLFMSCSHDLHSRNIARELKESLSANSLVGPEPWQLRHPVEEGSFPLPVRWRPIHIPGFRLQCENSLIYHRDTSGKLINIVEDNTFTSDPEKCGQIACPQGHPSIEIQILTQDEQGKPYPDATLRKAAHYLAKDQYYFDGSIEPKDTARLENTFLKKMKNSERLPLSDFLNPNMRRLLEQGYPPDSFFVGKRNCYSASTILMVPFLDQFPFVASSKAMFIEGWIKSNGSMDISHKLFEKVNGKPVAFGTAFADSSHSYSYLLSGFCAEKIDVNHCEYYHVKDCLGNSLNRSQTDRPNIKNPFVGKIDRPLETLVKNGAQRIPELTLGLSSSKSRFESLSASDQAKISSLSLKFYGTAHPKFGSIKLVKLYTGFPHTVESIRCALNQRTAKNFSLPICEDKRIEFLKKCQPEHWVEIENIYDGSSAWKKSC